MSIERSFFTHQTMRRCEQPNHSSWRIIFSNRKPKPFDITIRAFNKQTSRKKMTTAAINDATTSQKNIRCCILRYNPEDIPIKDKISPTKNSLNFQYWLDLSRIDSLILFGISTKRNGRPNRRPYAVKILAAALNIT